MDQINMENTNMFHTGVGLKNIEARETFIEKCLDVQKNLMDNDYPDNSKRKDVQKLATFIHECSQSYNIGAQDEETVDQVNKILIDLARSLYDYGKVQAYIGKEDVGYVSKDFDEVAEKSIACMQCLYMILLKVMKTNTTCDVQNSVTFYAFLLCCEHIEKELWTTDSSVTLADRVLQTILETHQVSVLDLLGGTERRSGMLQKLWPFILSRFSSTTWKQNPAMKHVYQWILLQLRFPHLSDHMDHILPPALLLVDDHELVNKLLGIRCLHHISENSTRAELSWFGRADVMYDSLQKLTYSHEASVIDILHPCMLKILSITEHKARDTNKPPVVSRYDEMFQLLLSNMELEMKLVMRRSYSRHLPLYINALGISTVKHFSRLFRVIFSYLDVYDGPGEESRINVLKALNKVILVCWPRIPGRCDDIIKSLVKLLYNTSVDKTPTPDDINNIIIGEAIDCLVLLKRLCPEKLILSLNAIRELELGPDCTRHIDTLLA